VDAIACGVTRPKEQTGAAEVKVKA
jgi:hypothetical protein